jgi:hypothetical protein
MLSKPIPYSDLESLSIRHHFFHLASHFLIAFLSLPIFLLNCAKECFGGLGFFLPFSAVRKPDFSVPSFSYHNNPWCCAWYMRPHASCRGCNSSRRKLSWEPCPYTWYQASCFHSCPCEMTSHWIVHWIFLGYICAQFPQETREANACPWESSLSHVG